MLLRRRRRCGCEMRALRLGGGGDKPATKSPQRQQQQHQQQFETSNDSGASGKENLDDDGCDDDKAKSGADEYDPWYGSALMRARQEKLRKMPVFDEEASAAEDVALIFAYVAFCFPTLPLPTRAGHSPNSFFFLFCGVKNMSPAFRCLVIRIGINFISLKQKKKIIVELWRTIHHKIRYMFPRERKKGRWLTPRYSSSNNAILCIIWFVYETLRDPALFARLHREVDDCTAEAAAAAATATSPASSSLSPQPAALASSTAAAAAAPIPPQTTLKETEEPPPPAPHDTVLASPACLARIVSQPRLQSVFAETLRLRVALGLSRFHDEWDDDNAAAAAVAANNAGIAKQNTNKMAKKPGFRLLGKWRFPQREHVLTFSLVAGLNPHAWGGGCGAGAGETGAGDGRQRSPDEFFAERFLEHPAAAPKPKLTTTTKPDAAIGATTTTTVTTTTDTTTATTTTTPERRRSGAADGLADDDDDDKHNIAQPQPQRPPPRFSLAGRAGAWIPFGGGRHICPGRHFAKREIIGTFAVLCDAFDMELLPHGGGGTQPDTHFFAVGAMPAKGKVPFRMRRRRRQQ
jgi:hypothetical protein